MHDKVISAAAAARMVKSGATVAVTGSGGGLIEPDALFQAIERRFCEEGSPHALTLVHALGLGDRDQRGTNRFAHDGMVRRVIGGHWTWSPRMQALARENRLEAYAFPSGAITHLLREIGAGRPGLITHVGLGTFADPRHGGGRMNEAAQDELVEVIQFDDMEYLRYKPFAVDVSIVRGTCADTAGNISFDDEPADLDGYVLALAAHNSGGIVIAQVRELVPAGTLGPRAIKIPGVLVDAVVVVPEQMQAYKTRFDAALVSRQGVRPAAAPSTDPVKRVIARRAALELTEGATLNFGFGASAQVATMIAERGDSARYWMTIEQGIHGGSMIDDDRFGMAYHPDVIIDSASQFDFYSGGGLDIAFLGMAEMDQAGNVNVSRLNGNVNGPGGFIDISQNAKTVVFCGTFDAKGAEIEVTNDQLCVRRAGNIQKVIAQVAQITFSGHEAQRRGQRVLYVTERATFELTRDGVELIEIAPGVDLQRDVLSQMGFTPILRHVGCYEKGVLA